MESGRTQWVVETRVYFFEGSEDGVAERVQAKRQDEMPFVRTLDAIYGWPAHEGREWPATIIPVPDDAPQSEAWAHFEAALGIDERYGWEELPESHDLG